MTTANFPPPPGPPVSPYQAPPPASGGGKAIAALVLGIVGLVLACVPLLGVPVCIVGIILGMKDKAGPKRGLAITGIVLSAIGLLLSLVLIAISAYLLATGKHPMQQPGGLLAPTTSP